jgi:CheY-like chemotaxis protein
MNAVALIIDDEVQIRRLLRLVLEAENYKVHEVETGQQGLMEIATRKPDVVLLDLGLPDLEGLQVLKRLREWSEVPVIVLTVRDDVQEKVAALDAGADDYITKPFSTPELLARVRAAQRKTRPSQELAVFQNGDLVVDLMAHVVTRGGHEIKLTATEYALLRETSWTRSYASIHPARNLGPKIRGASAVPPRLRHPFAPKDRARACKTICNSNSAGHWLPIRWIAVPLRGGERACQ